MTANITTHAALYLAPGGEQAEGRSEFCRECAKALAEWMGWKLIDDTFDVAWIVVKKPHMPWPEGHHPPPEAYPCNFNPCRSLDDLQPVLREIAAKGLFNKFINELSSTFETPTREEAIEFFGEDFLAKISLKRALLSSPLALADAAWAAISERKEP